MKEFIIVAKNLGNSNGVQLNTEWIKEFWEMAQEEFEEISKISSRTKNFNKSIKKVWIFEYGLCLVKECIWLGLRGMYNKTLTEKEDKTDYNKLLNESRIEQKTLTNLVLGKKYE